MDQIAKPELNVKQAAKLLGVSPQTIVRYIGRGLLAARDASPESNHHDWRVPFDAAWALRHDYRVRVKAGC